MLVSGLTEAAALKLALALCSFSILYGPRVSSESIHLSNNALPLRFSHQESREIHRMKLLSMKGKLSTYLS